MAKEAVTKLCSGNKLESRKKKEDGLFKIKQHTFDGQETKLARLSVYVRRRTQSEGEAAKNARSNLLTRWSINYSCPVGLCLCSQKKVEISCAVKKK